MISAPSPRSEHQRAEGFTLIELSIVIVIIGLIVGGVLVGQELIKAAEIRAQIGQIEKYNTAVNTFRSRYNGIPGDITSVAASTFGFTTRAGSTGRGDGNGLLEGSATGSTVACAETVLIWNDLNTANLIDGSFTGADGDATSGSCTTGATNSMNIVPAAKLGKSIYIFAYNANGLNYWHLIGPPSIISNHGAAQGASVATAPSEARSLTPSEAYQIDFKTDDGYPLTGIVTARTTALALSTTFPAATTPGAAAVGVCANSGNSPATYNTAPTTGGNSGACSIRIQFN